MNWPIVQAFTERWKRLKTLASQGHSPERVAISAAAGFSLGIFPIMGFSGILCVLLAFAFRLNHTAVHSASYVMGPLKLLMIFPFLRLGEALFQAPPLALNLAEFTQAFFQDWQNTTRTFGWSFVHAIVGWMVSIPAIGLIGFLMTRQWIRKDSDSAPPSIRRCSS